MGSRVPDAWDDDFEAHADNKQPDAPTPKARQTKAERRAQHAETQRALWNSADAPSADPAPFHLVGSHAPPPLAGGFKPPVTLLSRKPKVETRPAPGGDDDDEPDSEEEARRNAERDMKARTELARAQREEKARKYAEVRSRLFGEDDAASAAAAAAAPASPGRGPSRLGQNGAARGLKGKGRGGGGGGRSGASAGASSNASTRTSSADQSPARGGPAAGRTLFDPEYSSKPGSAAPVWAAGRETESPVLRQPRGPDAAGRGFARRGGSGEVS